MASVDGLAPSKFDLKGRSLELLCIHGPLCRANKWSPRLVSRQRLFVFSEALICLSYSGENDLLNEEALRSHRAPLVAFSD